MAEQFLEQRCTFPISLHPSRLGNVRAGVEEQLNSLLLTFVEELNGVLLAYSDLALSADEARNPLHCGFIFQERSYVHFRVEVKALVWRVEVGRRVEGVVNSVASDHLSLLLHGAFPVTIPLSGTLQPEAWRWEPEKERWIDESKYAGEEALKEEADGEEEGVKDEDDAAEPAPGKKLTKKELKKLERRRLRDVMLAATGRGSAAVKQAKPPAGVIARGVHVRFECSAVQHSDEYFKLTGVVVSRKTNDTGLPLGLTGGFTPLAPVEAVAVKQATNDQEGEENGVQATQDADGDFDMSALAAVTAPSSAVKAAPAKSAAPTPAAAAPVPPKKVHTEAQQAKFLKKQQKLAERLAAKSAGGESKEEAENEVEETPKKKRKAGEEKEETETQKKKTKKVKRET
jgi:hypothetical protein